MKILERPANTCVRSAFDDDPVVIDAVQVFRRR